MIRIKRNVSFYLQKVYNKKDNEDLQIRMRVRWNSNIAQFNCGYTIRKELWDAEASRCRKKTVNSKGISANEINKELSRMQMLADEIFESYEQKEIVPGLDDFKNSFNTSNGKTDKKSFRNENGMLFSDCFDKFTSEKILLMSISEKTIQNYKCTRNTVCRLMPGLHMEDIDRFGTDELAKRIINSGIKSTTSKTHINYLSAFLKWAYKKGIINTKSSNEINVNIKTVKDKQIIFLTWEELMKVYNMEIQEGELANIRDMFCMECFTSIRFSDLIGLKWENISNGKITVVQKKTGKTVTIQLNKYSNAILERRRDLPSPFPKISNNNLNKTIKMLCKQAGIREKIPYSYYRGGKRYDEVKEKYELITSHCGRRTFISNALMMGIPVTTVMSWTGHSNYASMKPYISVAEKDKEEAMKAFDER